MRTLRKVVLPPTRTRRFVVSVSRPRHVAWPRHCRRKRAVPPGRTVTLVASSDIDASTAFCGAGAGAAGKAGGGPGAAEPAIGPSGDVRPTPVPPALAACTSHRIWRPTSRAVGRYPLDGPRCSAWPLELSTNAYVNDGALLQLPGSQVRDRPALGTPRITAPPPRGARGGDSLPSRKLWISGAATLAKPFTAPGGQCSPGATRPKSSSPSRTAGGVCVVSPPPLSPWHASPVGELAQTKRAFASKPHVRL